MQLFCRCLSTRSLTYHAFLRLASAIRQDLLDVRRDHVRDVRRSSPGLHRRLPLPVGRRLRQLVTTLPRLHSEQTHQEGGDVSASSGEIRRRRIQQKEDSSPLQHACVGMFSVFIFELINNIIIITISNVK